MSPISLQLCKVSNYHYHNITIIIIIIIKFYKNINFFNTGAVAKSSIKATGERNVTYPVKKTMEHNGFEEDTLRGVYKLNERSLV